MSVKNMHRLRVAHLVGDLIRGGTEGQCARVAMGLANLGMPHRVAVFRRRGFFLEAVEDACGPLHEVAIRHMVRAETVRQVVRFSRWLRQERIDVVHAWDADAAIFGQFAARGAGIELVTSRRDLGQIYPCHKRILLRRADRAALRVVANAEAIRRRFVAQGVPEDKIAVLPNLLDLEEFDRLVARPFPRAEELPVGRRLVVVNRLDPEKNAGLLIEALPQVRKTVPDAVLVIAGDGREMPMLRQKASSLGVAPAVLFLGDVAEVPALLRACEIGALVPSRNEGLSNTILEYMAAGLPVLATDCGGNRELVADGETGRIVPRTASPSEVAQTWIGLLKATAESRAMGANGRIRVEGRYAVPRVLSAFSAFYEEIAGLLPPGDA